METDAFHIAEQAYFDALQLSQAAKLLSLQAKLKNRLSGVMDIQGRQLEALSFLEEALEIYISLDDKRGRAVCLCNIGGIKAALDQFDIALKCLKEALNYSKSINDYVLSIKILLNIGFNCVCREFYQESLIYYREAKDIAKSQKDYVNLVNCLVNEGDALLKLNKLVESGKVLSEALSTSKLHGITRLQVESLDNLGFYYQNIEVWQEAIQHHHHAHQLAQSIDYAEGQLSSTLAIEECQAA